MAGGRSHLLCPHVPPWGREVPPNEPSTEPGSDPSPAAVAWSVLSQVTSAPCTPGHSLLLPSQLAVEAPVILVVDVHWKNVTFTGQKKKKKPQKLSLFSRHLLAFPGTEGCLGSAGDPVFCPWRCDPPSLRSCPTSNSAALGMWSMFRDLLLGGLQ